MDFSKLTNKIFFDNKFIAAKNANIHVLNHSLHFATAVFEGIRVYNRKSLFLDDHVSRLLNSSKLMRLNVNISKNRILEVIKKLIKLNKIEQGYIRPIIFRSSHSMSPETLNCKTHVVVACWEWGNLFKSDGISLDIAKYPKLNKKIYPIQAKSSGSYQASVIARVDSAKKKYDDSLMLDTMGNVAESSACNIFWIKKNKIYTTNEHSILNGITRQSIIKLCKKNKISIKIGNYKLEKILKADSVFLTGTAAEIQPVKKILHKNFKVDHILIKLLKDKYNSLKLNPPGKVSKMK
jgi:branched-chain amino acid aminotransferase